MTAPGDAPQRKSLTATLIQDLSARIADAALRPGDRLHTERELMGAFGVSRSVVREATSSLRAEGLVLTRQGKGAFVSREGARAAFRLTEADVITLQDVTSASTGWSPRPPATATSSSCSASSAPC
jgi:GntR family transcriptional regulator, transcriptional repressor for pyruvate dehydrogenase complex